MHQAMRLRNMISIASVLCSVVAIRTTTASASLGEQAESVATVQRAMGPSRHTETAHEAYTMHEIVSDGLTIREYVGKDGVIFAAAWEGMTQPDLTPILGAYLKEFQQTNQRAPKANHRRSRSETHSANIVVIKSGHMRSARGKAFIVSRLPQGVTADDIQ